MPARSHAAALLLLLAVLGLAHGLSFPLPYNEQGCLAEDYIDNLLVQARYLVSPVWDSSQLTLRVRSLHMCCRTCVLC